MRFLKSYSPLLLLTPLNQTLTPYPACFNFEPFHFAFLLFLTVGSNLCCSEGPSNGSLTDVLGATFLKKTDTSSPNANNCRSASVTGRVRLNRRAYIAIHRFFPLGPAPRCNCGMAETVYIILNGSSPGNRRTQDSFCSLSLRVISLSLFV